jgi:membrane-associated protein
LLFAAGAFAAVGVLNPWVLCILLAIAAILGDALNYTIGARIGPKIFRKENVRFLNKEYLLRTHEFYEKHGGKTIIIARFMPIIRTFAPFVAGIGKMTYAHFAIYNITGAVLWVCSFVLGGYYFGNIPVVKRNFTLVIFAIIFISILPGIIAFFNDRRKKFRNQPTA